MREKKTTIWSKEQTRGRMRSVRQRGVADEEDTVTKNEDERI